MSPWGSKGQGKSNVALDNYTPKQLKAIETQLQVKSRSRLVRTLDAVGVSFKGTAKGKGKGKGKDKTDPSTQKGKGPQGKPEGSKGKGKEKGGKSGKERTGKSSGGSSSTPSAAQQKPTIYMKGTNDEVATMLDRKMQERPIQFICHACFLAHYQQRKECVACRAGRDLAKEPVYFDPDLHTAKVVKQLATASLPRAPAKEDRSGAAQPLAAGQADAAAPLQEAGPATPLAEDSMDIDAEAKEEEPDLGQWHPACLSKASMKLCIQEGCTEVLKYKKHFDIKDVAESELVQQLELLRRRLSIYEIDPTSFAQDMVHTKQRIGQLE
jgi:hypothetical protein